MNKLADRFVERFAEVLLIVLFLSFAAVWDVLISPELNGAPIPIFLFTIVLLLLLFAPKRWA